MNSSERQDNDDNVNGDDDDDHVEWGNTFAGFHQFWWQWPVSFECCVVPMLIIIAWQSRINSTGGQDFI